MSALRVCITILFFLLSAGKAFSQWTTLGTAGFTAGSAYYTTIDVAGGVPYIGFSDGSASSKMTVQKYNGSAWEIVGTAGFSPSAADYTVVHLIGGVPYAAFKDHGNSAKATVMKYNGSSWVYVGTPGFSAGIANDLSLSSDGTYPYLAYQDAANGNKITVQKFNGSTWSVVGTAGISTGTGSYTSLFLYNTTPYVAFKDAGVGSGKAVVKKFNGSSWVNVGTSGFSAGIVNNTSLFVSNDTAYIAYSDNANGNYLTVMKYNGSSWVNVGYPGFSGGQAFSISLVVYNGTPVVSFQDGANNFKASSLIFTGTRWKRVYKRGFSSGTADYISMKIVNGTAYVVCKDAGVSSKATVFTNANVFSNYPNYTVSGSTGTGNATITYNDDTTYTAVSDGSGNYSFTAAEGFTSTLSVLKLGYTFSPSSINITDLSANSSGNNFTHTLVYEAVQPSGAGTAQSPYLIANLGNLLWMALSTSHWNKYYQQTANIDASVTSGWYNGAGFPLVGNLSQPFTGSYNGAGFTISNLYINNGGQEGCGFIAIFQGISLQNINLTNVSITGNQSVGGLCGFLYWGAISNCSVSGTVSGNTYTGGLVGLIYSESGTITLSKANVTVTNSGDGGGGLVGNNGGAIDKSAAFGNVSGGSSLGGFVGINYGGTTTNCYSTGKVSGTGSFQSITGGFAGLIFGGSITNCYSNGWVKPAGFAGGFLGYSATGSVLNCFWNTQTSGLSSSAAGTGKTTAELRVQSLFTSASWNFTTIWGINSGRNFGSPFLQGITLDSVSVAGNTQTGSVLISYTDGSAKSVTSDNAGNYSFNVIFGWVGTISPSKASYLFAPPVYTINGISYDSTGINFTVELITAGTPSGSGTAADPFIITTLDNLIWLSEKPNYWSAYYSQRADIDASSSTTINSGAGFSPIGKTSTNFTGYYDGGGHVIKNLYINRGSQDTIGFFGYVSGSAVLKNIRLTGVNITGGNYSATLVGFFDGDSVVNCYTTGAIVCSSGQYIGGFVSTNMGGHIVTSGSECNVTGYYIAAGFVAANSGTITNCYARGSVGWAIYTAGFIGVNQGSLTNCYSTGAVLAAAPGYNYGFTAFSQGTINSCYWDTQTSGISTSGGGTGKTTAEMKTQGTFTGWNFTSPWAINAIVNNNYPYIQALIIPGGSGTSQIPYAVSNLNHLYWISTNTSSWSKYFKQSSDISASATSAWNSAAGFSPIGNSTTKFTGSYDGNGYIISDLFINRAATHIGLFGNTSSAATITELGLTNVTMTGRTYTGALVGLNEGTISLCYSSGSVKINGAYSHLGGLTGRNQGTITDSYSTAACSSGSTIVGGFAGSNTGTITRCYSAGSVTGSTTLGGLIAQNTGSLVTNSFWDTQTSGRSTSAAGTGKTTSEMKTQSTFLNAGWSLDTWNMGDGINNGYAYLKWQNPAGTALPVELEKFSAALSGSKVHLNWTTAVEVNNFGFEVQRAVKSDSIYINWEKIGFVDGNGNTNVSHSYTFRDLLSQAGSYAYRLKQIDADGSFSLTEPVLIDFGIPVKFELYQNYPNPFNPSTKIRYDIPAASQVKLEIYTILGDKIMTVVDEIQQPGSFTVDLNMSGYPSGTYICRLSHNTGSSVIKLMLIK